MVTTLAEVKRALQKNRCRVANNKDFRPLLLQHIIQYVCNSVTASEAGLSHDQSFLAQLKSWIKQRLIPFLNETSLSEYVPELESAVDGPTASQEGGLQTSRSVVPVALASHFGEFQHKNNCCENCAAPCNPSREQGFACNCGAIVCRRFCYGLTRAEHRPQRVRPRPTGIWLDRSFPETAGLKPLYCFGVFLGGFPTKRFAKRPRRFFFVGLFEVKDSRSRFEF